jgi:hypothetical protein
VKSEEGDGRPAQTGQPLPVLAGGDPAYESRLREHLESSDGCTASATHYGWEITSNPRAREVELLREYETSHGRLPRCNAV